MVVKNKERSRELFFFRILFSSRVYIDISFYDETIFVFIFFSSSNIKLFLTVHNSQLAPALLGANEAHSYSNDIVSFSFFFSPFFIFPQLVGSQTDWLSSPDNIKVGSGAQDMWLFKGFFHMLLSV